MDVVDQKFRISQILLLNSVTVKNMKFHVYLLQKGVYYPIFDRKLYRSYLSNYVHFYTSYFKFKLLLFEICKNSSESRGKIGTSLKPIFHLATLFARREAKTRIRQSDWLKLAGEKIRREQVGSVPTFLSVHANKVAKWKIGLKLYL